MAALPISPLTSTGVLFATNSGILSHLWATTAVSVGDHARASVMLLAPDHAGRSPWLLIRSTFAVHVRSLDPTATEYMRGLSPLVFNHAENSVHLRFGQGDPLYRLTFDTAGFYWAFHSLSAIRQPDPSSSSELTLQGLLGAWISFNIPADVPDGLNGPTANPRVSSSTTYILEPRPQTPPIVRGDHSVANLAAAGECTREFPVAETSCGPRAYVNRYSTRRSRRRSNGTASRSTVQATASLSRVTISEATVNNGGLIDPIQFASSPSRAAHVGMLVDSPSPQANIDLFTGADSPSNSSTGPRTEDTVVNHTHIDSPSTSYHVNSSTVVIDAMPTTSSLHLSPLIESSSTADASASTSNLPIESGVKTNAVSDVTVPLMASFSGLSTLDVDDIPTQDVGAIPTLDVNAIPVADGVHPPHTDAFNIPSSAPVNIDASPVFAAHNNLQLLLPIAEVTVTTESSGIDSTADTTSATNMITDYLPISPSGPPAIASTTTTFFTSTPSNNFILVNLSEDADLSAALSSQTWNPGWLGSSDLMEFLAWKEERSDVRLGKRRRQD
ncbi:hypothetical protein BV22DRAFT_1134195 [Leucogyrophana mollusca]|uniref:Uncharacterized protein n=1 Tax=Leucogyrophana mollusca TaxID=85980 RepID=A0ACB8AZG3_9AGAM|nr:hypothetical protein BV22DRAFT_1134195 [Leucogyrophana mollusca]